jgi:ABC-type polysaccharide/polyol phosphate transport system ATPase subunit
MGLTRREVAERMDAIVAFSGLEAWLNMPIRTCSSGMVARLDFSVAVHLDPEILLIDEILAVGTPTSMQSVMIGSTSSGGKE